jgi:hypothetical protein
MFGFSFFSMNIVYLLFAAVYMVSFGVISYNKLGEKLKVKPDENCARTVMHESQDDNPENTLRLFEDTCDAALLEPEKSVHFSREYIYPPGLPNYHYCPGIICSNLFSRPPPSRS